MTCKHCSYCWKSNDERFPSCKYEKIAEWDLAPCEIEDDVNYDYYIEESSYWEED